MLCWAELGNGCKYVCMYVCTTTANTGTPQSVFNLVQRQPDRPSLSMKRTRNRPRLGRCCSQDQAADMGRADRHHQRNAHWHSICCAQSQHPPPRGNGEESDMRAAWAFLGAGMLQTDSTCTQMRCRFGGICARDETLRWNSGGPSWTRLGASWGGLGEDIGIGMCVGRVSE